MANEKKFYTFVNITEGTEGTHNITAALTLTHPDYKELTSGKKVLTTSAAFSNREKMLSDALGTELKGQDGTLWADVNFWDNMAERFQKFLNGRDKVRLIVCGRLTLRKWTTKDGVEANRVQIAVNDWYQLPMTNAATTPANPADAVFDKEEDELF